MFNPTSLIQETRYLPLEFSLIKPAFLLQNHPKYLWKHLGTEGRPPAMKDEWLYQGSQIRKVPISINISRWCNSGIIQHPRRVLLQTSRNLWSWMLLVNGFPWVPNLARIRRVEGKISEKQDAALYWPSCFCVFYNDLQLKSLFPFHQRP